MVHTYDKMRRSNAKARDYLAQQGYFNVWFFTHSRFGKGVNIDEQEFDGLCFKLLGSQKITVFFQVKSNRRISKKLAAIYEEISIKYGIGCLWLHVPDRKAVEVRTFGIQ